MFNSFIVVGVGWISQTTLCRRMNNSTAAVSRMFTQMNHTTQKHFHLKLNIITFTKGDLLQECRIRLDSFWPGVPNKLTAECVAKMTTHWILFIKSKDCGAAVTCTGLQTLLKSFSKIKCDKCGIFSEIFKDKTGMTTTAFVGHDLHTPGNEAAPLFRLSLLDIRKRTRAMTVE